VVGRPNCADWVFADADWACRIYHLVGARLAQAQKGYKRDSPKTFAHNPGVSLGVGRSADVLDRNRADCRARLMTKTRRRPRRPARAGEETGVGPVSRIPLNGWRRQPAECRRARRAQSGAAPGWQPADP